jgi:hypothetical protein
MNESETQELTQARNLIFGVFVGIYLKVLQNRTRLDPNNPDTGMFLILIGQYFLFENSLLRRQCLIAERDVLCKKWSTLEVGQHDAYLLKNYTSKVLDEFKIDRTKYLMWVLENFTAIADVGLVFSNDMKSLQDAMHELIDQDCETSLELLKLYHGVPPKYCAVFPDKRDMPSHLKYLCDFFLRRNNWQLSELVKSNYLEYLDYMKEQLKAWDGVYYLVDGFGNGRWTTSTSAVQELR